MDASPQELLNYTENVLTNLYPLSEKNRIAVLNAALILLRSESHVFSDADIERIRDEARNQYRGA